MSESKPVYAPLFLFAEHLTFNSPLAWQGEGFLLLRKEASLSMASLTSCLPLLGWSSCLPHQGQCLHCGLSPGSGGKTSLTNLHLDFTPSAKFMQCMKDLGRPAMVGLFACYPLLTGKETEAKQTRSFVCSHRFR